MQTHTLIAQRQMKTARTIAGLIAACIASSSPLAAQSFALDWHTVDGGGRTSTGGVYSVSGTIGQPDAGGHRGGNFALVGGFWGVAEVIQTEGAPVLYAAKAGASVVIFWEKPATGFVLDETAALTPSPISWSQVPFPYQTNATHIFVTVPAPVGNKFYRLRKP